MQPRQNPSLVVRQEEQGKYLVYNRESQVPLVLNATSHCILSLCDGSRDLEEIQKAVAEEFDLGEGGLGEEQLKKIVEDHITLMGKLRILVT